MQERVGTAVIMTALGAVHVLDLDGECMLRSIQPQPPHSSVERTQSTERADSKRQRPAETETVAAVALLHETSDVSRGLSFFQSRLDTPAGDPDGMQTRPISQSMRCRGHVQNLYEERLASSPPMVSSRFHPLQPGLSSWRERALSASPVDSRVRPAGDKGTCPRSRAWRAAQAAGGRFHRRGWPHMDPFRPGLQACTSRASYS